jgi:hypothetical protein
MPEHGDPTGLALRSGSTKTVVENLAATHETTHVSASKKYLTKSPRTIYIQAQAFPAS